MKTWRGIISWQHSWTGTWLDTGTFCLSSLSNNRRWAVKGYKDEVTRLLPPRSLQSYEETYVHASNPSKKPLHSKKWSVKVLVVTKDSDDPWEGAILLRHEFALIMLESHSQWLSSLDLPVMKLGALRVQEKLGIHQDPWTDPRQMWSVYCEI